MSDKVRDILSLGQQIMGRRRCSENDIVYHILAPLLEAVGWQKIEIYFECGEGGSIPDITLNPSDIGKTILTIEAKALGKATGWYKGWRRQMVLERSKPRADVPYQVFRQLIDNAHSHAWLSDGRDFSLFTLRKVRENLYEMICLYSITISDILKDDKTLSDFKELLSRNTHCKDRGPLRKLEKELGADKPPERNKKKDGDELPDNELPDNWHQEFQTWAESFGAGMREPDEGFQYFQSLCGRNPQELSPFEKRSFYHLMRFCQHLGPKLPSGWRLVFEIERGKKKRVNVKLFPNWIHAELQGRSGSSLFQITPNGSLPGIIYFGAADLRNQQEGTPLWHLNKIKREMKNDLPPNIRIYQSGVLDRLISVSREVRDKLIKAGLILD
jgi:hypothetical protein